MSADKDQAINRAREVLQKYGQPENVDKETQRQIEHAEIKPPKTDPEKDDSIRDNLNDIRDTFEKNEVEAEDTLSPEKEQEIENQLGKEESVINKYGEKAPEQEPSQQKEQDKERDDR